MTYDTVIRVGDPVSPRELVKVAAGAAGVQERPRKHEFRREGAGMLHASGGSRVGLIGVHYVLSGGRFQDSSDGPPAYVVLTLTSGSPGGQRRRQQHEEALAQIGAWLDQQGLTWWWSCPVRDTGWVRGRQR